MGVEITRKKDGSPSSNWWYGRFKVNGKSKCVNLGIKIEGRVPVSLKETGDTAFERSRIDVPPHASPRFKLGFVLSQPSEVTAVEPRPTAGV